MSRTLPAAMTAACLLLGGLGCTESISTMSWPGVGADLPILTDAVGRAITWENRTGEPGAGGKALGGRKGSPRIEKPSP